MQMLKERHELMKCKSFMGYLTLALLGHFFTSGSIGQQISKELPKPPSEKSIAAGGGEIGNLLRKWYSSGDASGNVGDYYDNRDGGHSMLDMAPYPQLQKIEYTEEQLKNRQNWAMQKKVLPNVVFGNSSTSATPESGGSNARNYYSSPGGLDFLFMQYSHNNLYIYPEHQDHDPGHNGIGGYGDLFPTNSPYLIASQGSSGSDQPFMQTLPYVLAAFKPEVKQTLIKAGLLMPTIQMIMRITNKQIAGSKEYLTGKAHPTVFQGSDVNARAMVEMAHGIDISDVPPIALLKVLKEDSPANDADFFEPDHTEKLADTPALIARVFRGAKHVRKIAVSAQNSRDLNNRPLKYYWIVLRGDAERIKIEYINSSRSIAEITVPYYERRPIAAGSSLESNRIDIGVFVHNGVYYSPPAFITFYTLDNEARTYSADGRLLEIGYGAGVQTISVADWKLLFDALEPNAKSWPGKFLQKQFKTEELATLHTVAEDYRKIHTDPASDKQKEKQVLEKKMPGQAVGASELVQRVLNSFLQDTNLCSANAGDLKPLYDSANSGTREAFDNIRQKLIRFGIAENPGANPFPIKPMRKINDLAAADFTSYEKGMIERMNAVLLSRLIFPGIIAGEWRENYVDFRIAAAKEWRDIYRYAPDGTPAGWQRYHSDKVEEFTAEGLLILEKDHQGRCIRARVVRYELEPRNQDSNGRPVDPSAKKVKMIPTNTLCEYEYTGATDWKGRVKTK